MTPTARNLVTWMSQRGPDDWHRVAISWNWDGDYHVLHWIIEQPLCDLRTAQVLFVLSSPDYFLKFKDRSEAVKDINISNFDFVADLMARAHAGQFVSTLFTDDFADSYTAFLSYYRESESQNRANGLPWELPGAFVALAAGPTHIRADGYTEGYPPEFTWE